MSSSRRIFQVQRNRSYVSCLAAVVVVWATFCSVTKAQPAGAPKSYTWGKVDPQYDDHRFVTTQKLIKENVLYGKAALAANQTAVDNWYRNYLVQSMLTPEKLGELADIREDLMKDVRKPQDRTVHQFMVDLAYDEMTKIVQGSFHPAVQHNAMLIIGDLNDTEDRTLGAQRYPAVRLGRALDFMLAQLKRPDISDSLRLAAMIGVLRHVELDRKRPTDQPVSEDQKNEILTLMTGMVQEKTSPITRSAEGHTWMRRRAVDVLAALGKRGPNDAVLNDLVAVVADSETPLSLRCSAARALEGLDYSDASGVDALAVARDLGALAAYACRQEDARVKEEQKKTQTAGASGGYGMPGLGGGMPGLGGGYPGGSGGYPGGSGGYPGGSGGYPGGSGGYPGGSGGYPGGSGGYPGGSGGSGTPGAVTETPEPDQAVQQTRRRLKLPLDCVLRGLRGTDESSSRTSDENVTLGAIGQLAQDPAQKAEVVKIAAALEALLEATDKHEQGLDELMKEVRTKILDLENLLPKSETKPEPAADLDVPGGDAPGGAPASQPGDAGNADAGKAAGGNSP